MKGYIAICQHFHQPHFQLQNTREKVFRLSYLNWLDLLESLSATEGFYINMHFSGPFLYWLKSEKKEYLTRLASLVRNGNIGIIGGFADEAFIQLSTRTDDVMFQIQEYEKLTKTLFHIQACDWQGFHIPERECGELLLRNTTRALSAIKGTPIYYLDAETFYQSHYAEPGGEADYCEKLFGFKDPVSKTTIPHYPKSLLRFAFRDLIGGQSFISLPIHCEERYWFLKYDHNIGIRPRDYLTRIKKTLNKAAELSSTIGKDIVPIAVIFEDAEKFGDWSGQPDRDILWLHELIELICHDDDIELIGLKKYFAEQGVFDTYPIRSSHSYIEWENWTAKRGIRGVVYSDEKIRKMVASLHQFESRIECFERQLLRSFANLKSERFIEAVMDTPERYVCIFELLQNHVNEAASEQYLLLQRIRNLLYQEDSKWATRHPNYGSAPYLDNMGICYLEIAKRLLYELESVTVPQTFKDNFSIVDWMEDTRNRIVVCTEHQTLSIDPKGAGIDYHVVLNQKYSIDKLFSKTLPDIKEMKTYSSIYRYVNPIVFTETDSRLCHIFHPDGERIEKCRRSFTICLSHRNGNKYEQIAAFHDSSFSMHKHEQTKNGYRLVFQAIFPVNIENHTTTTKLTRIYLVRKGGITVKTTVETEDNLCDELFLSTEVVTSVTASDEINFLPAQGIAIPPGEERCCFEITYSDGSQKCHDCPSNGTLLFNYCIQTGASDTFWNGIRYSFSASSAVSHILTSPAISNYYEQYVGNEQSQLGYTSSGLMIVPFTKLEGGKASITIRQDFLWNVKMPTAGRYFSLVEL